MDLLISTEFVIPFLFQLWVGPHSRAAEEKQFFDNHLAPFYRIEQVWYCFLYFNFFLLVFCDSCKSLASPKAVEIIST